MAFLSPAQLLLLIAEHEELEVTRALVPDLSLEEARKLLRGAATSLRRAEPEPELPLPPVRSAPPPGSAPHKSAPPAAAAKVKKPAARGATAAAHPVAQHPEAHQPALAGDAGAAHKPGVGKVRVFSDGAARGNPGPAGAGAVVIDERGNVLGRYGKFLGRQTNNVAEYEGLLLGLRHAQELGAREVDVRADSELMIRQLEGRYQVKNPGLKPLHAEALRLLGSFERHGLRHVPRAENALADEMSNRAIDDEM